MGKGVMERLKALAPEAVPPPGMTEAGLEAFVLEGLRRRLQGVAHGLEYLPGPGLYRAWIGQGRNRAQGYGRQAWAALARAYLELVRRRGEHAPGDGAEDPGGGGPPP